MVESCRCRTYSTHAGIAAKWAQAAQTLEQTCRDEGYQARTAQMHRVSRLGEQGWQLRWVWESVRARRCGCEGCSRQDGTSRGAKGRAGGCEPTDGAEDACGGVDVGVREEGRFPAWAALT